MTTIMRLTFIEMKKRRILYLTIGLTILFLGLYGFALKEVYKYFQTEEVAGLIRVGIISQMTSMGIYASGLIVSFLSIFASSGAISADLENGTYDAILSKPIHRWEILLGRYLGVLSLIIPYSIILIFSVLGLNLFFGKSAVAGISTISTIRGIAYFSLLPTLLCSVGIFLSSTMSTLGSGIILGIMYFIGMIGGIIEGIGSILQNKVGIILGNIGIVTSLIMPTDVVYRKAVSSVFTGENGINLAIDGILQAKIQPSPAMIIYVFIYVIFFVVWAIKKFEKRDL